LGPIAVPHEPDEADRTSLDEAEQLAEERGLPAGTKLLSGNAADEIVAYADLIDADLIVVGSRGHGAVSSALLGSVSRSVLRHAACPVLVARGVPAHAEAVV
jgi:nucleotide-binding universal stress UspA family protein